MKRFSERHGYPGKDFQLQIDVMTPELKNSLWSALTMYIWDRVHAAPPLYKFKYNNPYMSNIVSALQKNSFLTEGMDLNDHWPDTLEKIRKRYFESSWHEVYDLIEFIVLFYPDRDPNQKLQFIEFCNSVLKREHSAWSFINEKIVRTVSDEEIREINRALLNPSRAVAGSLQRALFLFSAGEKTDFAESINKSLAALTDFCNEVLGKQQVNLFSAIKEIEKKFRTRIVRTLVATLSRIYGYTEDAKKMRHPLLNESDLTIGDECFSLAVCKVFMNYIVLRKESLEDPAPSDHHTGHKISLGKTIALIEEVDDIKIRPILFAIYENLSGYGSEPFHIRRAINKVSDLTMVDARFVLFLCSVVINYISDNLENP